MPIRRRLLPAITALLALVAATSSLPASNVVGATPVRQVAVADPQRPSSYAVDLQLVAAGFDTPQGVVAVPDGSGNLLVLERRGRVVLVHPDGSVAAQPFLDLTRHVAADEREQGLFSVAFHPRYRENGLFYVHYSRKAEPDWLKEWHATIVRYRVSADPEVADPATAVVILDKEQPHELHWGGQLAFGPDGYLWIGFGDGGQRGRAESLDNLRAKLLRIDVDGGEPYAIPADNPFVGVEGAVPEAWAYGLRNPWRFSFDRLTGDLYIGDVGQNTYEEINFVPAGSAGGFDFGWSRMEGAHCFGDDPCETTGITLPVAEYVHRTDDRIRVGCAVTGGYVYRGAAFPAMYGAYLYGDFCNGRIWSLRRADDGTWWTEQVADTGRLITAFAEDEVGELYLVDYADGGLYRLVAATP